MSIKLPHYEHKSPEQTSRLDHLKAKDKFSLEEIVEILMLLFDWSEEEAELEVEEAVEAGELTPIPGGFTIAPVTVH